MTDNYTQSPKWTRRQLFGTLSAAVVHLEEWGACGVMVQREDLEAWAAEREELRDALAAMLEKRDGFAAYVETYDDTRWCAYCSSGDDNLVWRHEDPERHDDDCPVAAARALLEGGA